MCTNILSSVIYDSQKMETTKILSPNEWINRNVSDPYGGRMSSTENGVKYS